jgi:hypothetical protein
VPYALERKYPNASRDWVGNMCFLLRNAQRTRTVALHGVTMWRLLSYSVQ